ncbi:hypothetical protein AZI86_01660 [Bdellovibrio bacteriovorus]|uniref:Uncharacterized protein n=1 Tax=Bdellovibrio bacteriovorus TaxID=959 RepID=A0A150WNN0_BDEBC|nr:hypothetical protein [Bdellovibrio bacteriovorus]KYG65805.1 hypothetical protein AZI86_01660 [Bdellovibrio bacteriovorus]
MKKLIPFLIVIAGCASIPKASDFEMQAAEYLRQYKDACIKEDGVTWKHSLCVPMVIVDPNNLKAVSTEPDPEGRFEKFSNVYRGTYSGGPHYANTSVKWGGRNWSMVVWPLPEDQIRRTGLMFHEAFHSIQEDVGFPMNNALNTHLDQEEARILLRLEWNALLKALEDSAHRRDHVGVALQMRKLRFKKYPEAEKNEESMEMSEGVAEYTGMKLCGSTPEQTVEALRKKIEAVPEISSLTRSSAYYSGPLYGLLLDTKGPQWKFMALKMRSFGKITEQVFKIEPGPVSIAVLKNYGRVEIVKFETQRAQETKDKIARYLSQIEKPGKLEIVLNSPQAVFNPYGILSIDANTVIYETYEVRDEWGSLIVKEGTLFKFHDNRASIAVSPPSAFSENAAQGIGWELKLAPGWKLIKGTSNFTVKRL